MMFPFSNLRVRFLLLVLVAVLPALGLLFINASDQRATGVRDTQENASRLANLAAADQTRLFETTRQMLVVLGRLPEVREGSSACDALLAGLLSEFPQYANLGVVSPAGQLTCSGVPSEGSVDLSSRPYIQQAIETGQFTVGNYQEGVITERQSLNFGLPIYDDNQTLFAVVFAALDLEKLSSTLAQAAPANNAVVTVFDRNGNVLIRSQDASNWIGRPLAGTPVVDTILREGSGVDQATDETGEPMIWAYAPLGNPDLPDAYLAIATPRSAAEASADRTFNKNLTRLGLVLAVVGIAAWVGGDLLVRRDADLNKALVRRVYDAFDTGGVDQLDEVVVPNFVDHSPSQDQVQGLAGLKQAVGLFRAAFPDGEMTVNDMLGERNLVMARVTLCGTHTGFYGGVEPSGHYVSAEGIETYRIKDGKIVEGWSWFGPLRIDEPGFTPVSFPNEFDEGDVRSVETTPSPQEG